MFTSRAEFIASAINGLTEREAKKFLTALVETVDVMGGRGVITFDSFESGINALIGQR